MFSCNVHASANSTSYTRGLGETVYAIAHGLFLGSDGYLYICTTGTSDGDIVAPNSNLACKGNANINECDPDKDNFCYSGWVTYVTGNGNGGFERDAHQNKWFDFISEYTELSKILITINNKYFEIFSRLKKAQSAKKSLVEKYSEYRSELDYYDKYINQINSDIKQLSSHGFELAKVSKKLFRTIKPIVIDAEMRKDLITGRQDVMKGLRTFERELNNINKLPDAAIDESIIQIITTIDKAINQLERTLAQ